MPRYATTLPAERLARAFKSFLQSSRAFLSNSRFATETHRRAQDMSLFDYAFGIFGSLARVLRESIDEPPFADTGDRRHWNAFSSASDGIDDILDSAMYLHLIAS
jgi:hypothetical protein